MKNILWVSRHAMTERQREQLFQIYGDVSIRQFDQTVTDIAAILACPADVYAAVLAVYISAEKIQSILLDYYFIKTFLRNAFNHASDEQERTAEEKAFFHSAAIQPNRSCLWKQSFGL